MDQKRPADELIETLKIDLATTGKRASAAIVALSEEVILLREEIKQLSDQLVDAETMADLDTLVPVFNRRAFERELTREIAIAERYRTPLCLVFIDLDKFKLVNDRFGHPAGDDVLIKVGDILKASTREADLVGRLGGDEFGVALTHADLEDCQKKAISLAEAIDALTVRDSSDDTLEPVKIGASCGVSEWTPGTSPAALIAEADEAMFITKAARRKFVQDP